MKIMAIAAVDLFCGIGGLSYGLRLSGIDVVAGIDADKSCKYIYEQNNKSGFLCKDIAEITGKEVNALYPDNVIRVLVGCAPCQPFSQYSLRYHKNSKNDAKWGLLYEFSRIIEECQPDIVSMENVPGLRRKDIFRKFVSRLKKLHYNVDYSVVYCPDYGVPQKRKRLVLLASKLGIIKLIPPLYTADKYITVREAIGSLPPIGDGEICQSDFLHCSCKLSAINKKRIKQSVPGGTWRDWDPELRLSCHQKDSGKSYASVYGRMSWDEPSPTITTQFYGYGNGRFGHPEQDRALSIREGALLQSFPQDYIFIEPGHPLNRRKLGIHIGNAVPVKLGEAIGRSIIEHIRKETRHDRAEEKDN